MPVIVSGAGLEAMTHRLTVGSALRVHGFVSCHMGRNGLNKLVLHAEQIELIDSGD
ncbi:primosomal replication protein N [Edwardsiella piscicida]|nr:primosomal replication protein N [Edwardsiella sp. EA181011]GBK54299.1 primosomal replication protein N [Edwardsiella piscicida]GBK58342.1 primosomal replication protein N [Edwardsiella piscicida]